MLTDICSSGTRTGIRDGRVESNQLDDIVGQLELVLRTVFSRVGEAVGVFALGAMRSWYCNLDARDLVIHTLCELPCPRPRT